MKQNRRQKTELQQIELQKAELQQIELQKAESQQIELQKTEPQQIESQAINAEQLIQIINNLPAGNHIIAIDGRCAAGKTTLAERLSGQLGAGVVHMDDFYLPISMRTQERLAEPGGNVYYERFLKEVIPFLNQAIPFSYQRFDCSIMDLGANVQVPAGRFVIVEGAYSCHPKLGDYMSLRVFMDVAPEVQRERIFKRNGEERLKTFEEKWIPLEEAYFKTYEIQEQADFILYQEG